MNLRSPNELAALAPWLAGYEMADDHVAVLTFTAADRGLEIGPSAVLPCNELGNDLDAHTRETARFMTEAGLGAGDADAYAFVIGHGPAGDLLADRVAAVLPEALPAGTGVLTLHNDGENVRMKAPGLPWAEFGPPADISAEMIAAGKQRPAATRAMSDRLWAPDPIPSYPQLPTAEQDRLDATLPSDRAEVAVELLTDLAEGRASDIPTTQSRLGALMSSDTTHWVQDRILMASVTSKDPRMADELRQLYVQAPPAYQSSIGPTAAIATYAQHANSQPLRAMRDHLDAAGTSPEDARLLNDLAATMPEPRRFRAALTAAADRAISDGAPQMKDDQWRRGRTADPTGPGPNAPPRSTGPERPTSGAPGPEDLPPTTGPAGPSMS